MYDIVAMIVVIEDEFLKLALNSWILHECVLKKNDYLIN